jgi:hypothetical protein
MNQVAQHLRKLIDDARPRLLSLKEAKVSEKPYAEKWSLKEILGHLIDSASNNHQRFVRMQLQPDIGKFSYEQERWNSIQKYSLERWADIVELWSLYNIHLAHLIEHVDPGTLENTCDIDYPNPANLRFVMENYVQHVEHHLEQILSGTGPNERKKWVSQDPKSSSQ